MGHRIRSGSRPPQTHVQKSVNSRPAASTQQAANAPANNIKPQAQANPPVQINQSDGQQRKLDLQA